MKRPKTKREYEHRKMVEREINRQMNKNLPIAQWNYDTLLAVANDRGYRSESALVYAVAKELNVPYNNVKSFLKTGRMTWGQVVCLGAFLEMTPKEFCDTFLHGYFQETHEGTFRGHVDSYAPLLQKPK